MYWELYPTLDHFTPVAREGVDEMRNWVTTSMFRNAAKGNALIEEIGWTLWPKGDFAEWDGLLNWFVRYIEDDSTPLQSDSMKKWYRAARRVLATPT